MCLAILNEGKRAIPEQHLKNGFENNPHGAGFAYYDNGQLVCEKGFWTYDHFIEAYRPHNGKLSIVHFRWATHGGKGLENVHPFKLKDGSFLIHNGVIHNQGMGKNDHDTRFFIDNILSELPDNWYLSEVYRMLIADHIGASNKLCILGPSGSWAVINHDRFKWKSGIWYSNSDYKTARYERWENWEEFEADRGARKRLTRNDLLLGENDIAEQLRADAEELNIKYGETLRDLID